MQVNQTMNPQANYQMNNQNMNAIPQNNQMPMQMQNRFQPMPNQYQQMPNQYQQMPMANPQMMQYNNLPNQNQNQNQQMQNNNRHLFLGEALGSITGGLQDTAKSAMGGLGANGGAGAGLLGAGAGLAMATMGGDAEKEERSNLEQDLRSKEFRYMIQISKKQSEFNEMDKKVSWRFLRLV